MSRKNPFGSNMQQRKLLKLNDKTDESRQTTDIEPPSVLQHLDTLPPEILQIIFKHLSPEHLIFVENSCNPRVGQATALKKADFNDSRSSKDLMSSFFTPMRISYLKEIYLSEMLYIDSETIFKNVSKCKFLTKLNISYRGLSYMKILHILEKCKSMKELHWYVFLNARTCSHFIDNKTNHALEKIVLNVDSEDDKNLIICRDFLCRCDTEAQVYLNFEFSTITCKISREEDKRFFMKESILTFSGEADIYRDRKVLHKLRSCNFSYGDILYFQEEYQGFCVSLSKIYSIFKKAGTSKVLHNLPETPIHTLVLLDGCIEANEEQDKEFYLHLIEKVSLDGLKHLSVFHKSRDIQSEDPDRNYLSVRYIPDILLKCSYIQEVVLSDIHFENNCTALLNLKHLKTLVLSPCAMDPHLESSRQPHFLEILVTSCKYLESLSLRMCHLDIQCPRDDLKDINLFYACSGGNLKHVSFTGFHSVRTLTCLRGFPAHTKLTTLCLVEVGPITVCHYVSNLLYTFRLARNLTFLQISQYAFNPADHLFWMNLAKVKTLEGLCIATNRPPFVNSSYIIDSVIQLKHLHLFHLRAQVSDSLKGKIRKVMLSNNIQNPVVEIVHDLRTRRVCQLSHYPFIVPPYHHRVLSIFKSVL